MTTPVTDDEFSYLQDVLSGKIQVSKEELDIVTKKFYNYIKQNSSKKYDKPVDSVAVIKPGETFAMGGKKKSKKSKKRTAKKSKKSRKHRK